MRGINIEYHKDEIASVGIKFVRRSKSASRSDIFWWAEYPKDTPEAQVMLKAIKSENKKPPTQE